MGKRTVRRRNKRVRKKAEVFRSKINEKIVKRERVHKKIRFNGELEKLIFKINLILYIILHYLIVIFQKIARFLYRYFVKEFI